VTNFCKPEGQDSSQNRWELWS